MNCISNKLSDFLVAGDKKYDGNLLKISANKHYLLYCFNIYKDLYSSISYSKVTFYLEMNLVVMSTLKDTGKNVGLQLNYSIRN